MPLDIFAVEKLGITQIHMSIIQVLSRYHLKLLNDFKEGGIMAVLRPKPTRTLIR
jgi:hypothetical protein